MKEMPRIKSVMTPFPYSIEAAAPLSHARQMMEKHGFHQLPVMKDGELVHFVPRHMIEGRDALSIASDLSAAFAEFC